MSLIGCIYSTLRIHKYLLDRREIGAKCILAKDRRKWVVSGWKCQGITWRVGNRTYFTNDGVDNVNYCGIQSEVNGINLRWLSWKKRYRDKKAIVSRRWMEVSRGLAGRRVTYYLNCNGMYCISIQCISRRKHLRERSNISSCPRRVEGGGVWACVNKV